MVEEKLAELVLEGKSFKVKLPNYGTMWPRYSINVCDLKIDDIVGHIVILQKKPVLVISRIEEIISLSKKIDKLIGSYPNNFITIPVLHGWDKRTLEDLEWNKFDITADSVQCWFIPVFEDQ